MCNNAWIAVHCFASEDLYFADVQIAQLRFVLN
jgi:hypothetical protein